MSFGKEKKEKVVSDLMQHIINKAIYKSEKSTIKIDRPYQMFKEIDSVPKEGEPIANCNWEVRYYKGHNAEGALKYGPIKCSKIHDFKICQEIRNARHSDMVSFKFFEHLSPQCKRFDRKVMAVLSISCPKLLKDEDFLGNLLWAAEARERPTILVVHESEAKTYLSEITPILERFGVGLVSWRCLQNALGFGVSRLAAQHAAVWIGGKRDEVVLCDVNVRTSEDVAKGYHTDNEKEFVGEEFGLRGNGTPRYTGAGFGSGVSKYSFKNKTLQDNEKFSGPGELGRPIEQVVTVSGKMSYDPCFVMSSEDVDLTNEILFQETQGRDFQRESHDFKYRPDMTKRAPKESNKRGTKDNRFDIEKIDMSGNDLCQDYIQARKGYLTLLAHNEGKFLIRYKGRNGESVQTVSDVADEIVNESYASNKIRLDKEAISSLIIEKILLQAKFIHRGRVFEEENSNNTTISSPKEEKLEKRPLLPPDEKSRKSRRKK